MLSPRTHSAKSRAPVRPPSGRVPDGGLHPQVSEPPDPLGFGRFRDATLARTCSACTSVNGGSAIGSAVGRMPASMIAGCRRQAAGATSLDACMIAAIDHRPRTRWQAAASASRFSGARVAPEHHRVPSSALSTEGHSEIVPPTAAKNPVRRPAGRVARYRRSGRTCRQADR
jgi:hypothetical protein